MRLFNYPQNCYILIIPGFGIVSHVVSTFSGKSIFGQDDPKYNINILKQTICRELILCLNLNKILYNLIMPPASILNKLFY